MLSNLFFSARGNDQQVLTEKVNTLLQQEEFAELHQLLRLEARKNDAAAFKRIIIKCNKVYREKLNCYPAVSEGFNNHVAELKKAVDECDHGRISQLLVWYPGLWCYPLYHDTYTLFHYAAEFASLPLINHLLFFLNSDLENKQRVRDLPVPIGWQPRYLNQKLLVDIKKYIILEPAEKSKKMADIIELIAWKAEVDAVDELSGLQPIHYAAMVGNMILLEGLTEKGANLQAVTREQDTLLHLAIQHAPHDTDWQRFINLLVKKGVAIDAKNGQGIVPIELAKAENRRAAVRCLESTLVELNAARQSQNSQLNEKISIVVTYEDADSHLISVLLVRDNPLTRGWQSDFSRPIKKLTNANIAVPGYQFPGGGIQRGGQPVATWVNNYFAQPEDQQLAQASLWKLNDETGLALTDANLNQLNPSESFQFSLIKKTQEYDAENKQSVRRYFFHLSMGKLTAVQIDKLQQMMKMKHGIMVVSWIRLDRIYSAKDNYQQSAFSIIPQESGNTTLCRADEKGVEVIKRQRENRVVEIPRVGCLDLPVILNPLHAELLEALQFDIRKKPYELPTVLRFEDFQIEAEFVDNRYTRYLAQPISLTTLDNRYTRYLARHIPTNTLYQLKRPTPSGLIDKNVLTVASQCGLTRVQVLERFCRNELLAAKLYEAYGVNVLPINLIQSETGEWGVGYSDRPDLQIRKFSIKELQDDFLQGLACDIVFANFNAIESFGQSSLGYLTTAPDTIIRLDYSGALQFRGRGLLKEKQDWSSEVNLQQILQHERHGEFKKLCGQLDRQDWKKVRFVLTRVKFEKIQEIVKEYGYGTEQERQQLADLIITRADNTYRAITQHIQAKKQQMQNSANKGADNSQPLLQRMDSMGSASFLNSFSAEKIEDESKKSVNCPSPT